MQEPTKHMRAEAASAGTFASIWNSKHSRLQILTAREIFDGKTIDFPGRAQTNITHKKAKRAQRPKSEQLTLDSEDEV